LTQKTILVKNMN